VREADQLADWAGRVSAALTVPSVAIQAYGYAEQFLERTDPGCRLAWTTLAGIGDVESSHGQAGGAVLQPSGRSAPTILGPVQDGKGGRALVKDTDAGAFDGDTAFDRALGPLRLMPTEWRDFAIDADADGILDPFDIDDAALTLSRVLCAGQDDMGQRPGWNAGVARHRAGDAYAAAVFKSADSYGLRTRDIG
jgi:membrane-bound lytic murein transglycosylase B